MMAWDKLTNLLGTEMERRGLNDYSVEISIVQRASPQAQAREVREIVHKLEAAAKAQPKRSEASLW